LKICETFARYQIDFTMITKAAPRKDKMTPKVHKFPQKISLKGNVLNVDASWREFGSEEKNKKRKTKKNPNLLEFNELFFRMRLEIEKNHILLASLFEVASTLWMNENEKIHKYAKLYCWWFNSHIFTNHLFIYHSSFKKIAFISNIYIPSALLRLLPSSLSLESSQNPLHSYITSHPHTLASFMPP